MRFSGDAERENLTEVGYDREWRIAANDRGLHCSFELWKPHILCKHL